jgi:hypothetical protein
MGQRSNFPTTMFIPKRGGKSLSTLFANSQTVHAACRDRSAFLTGGNEPTDTHCRHADSNT